MGTCPERHAPPGGTGMATRCQYIDCGSEWLIGAVIMFLEY